MKPTTRLRQLLREPGIIVAPGAYDCLTAKIIEREGFSAVYMTGGGTSVTQIGQPDFGLTTMTEMITNADNIAATVDLPVIADADTGYGGVLNVHRTVRAYERAGVAGIHIEDQESPKRCGHLDDKRVISAEDMALKIRAAVEARTDDDFVIIVRTDALAVTGMDDTLSRCEKYVEAGAEVLFVEALRTPGGDRAGHTRLRRAASLQLRREGKVSHHSRARAGAAWIQDCNLPRQRHAHRMQGGGRRHAGDKGARHHRKVAR